MATAPATGTTEAAACCTPLAEAPLAEADAAALAHTYAAVADPVRLRLLSMIAAAGEMCSCDLMAPLATSQPTVSHHLCLLRHGRIVVCRREGKNNFYALSEAGEELAKVVKAVMP